MFWSSLVYKICQLGINCINNTTITSSGESSYRLYHITIHLAHNFLVAGDWEGCHCMRPWAHAPIFKCANFVASLAYSVSSYRLYHITIHLPHNFLVAGDWEGFHCMRPWAHAPIFKCANLISRIQCIENLTL